MNYPEINFLQVMPGGHCLICHGDYESEGSCPKCWPKGFGNDVFLENHGKASGCTNECYEKGRFMHRQAKKCPHCGMQIELTDINQQKHA